MPQDRALSQFDGRVVIVTGASAGLGRAYALELARQGASVLANARSAAVNETVDAIRAAGGQATACVGDAREGALIAQAALDAYGRIDALICNAGIVRDRSFAKMSEGEWDEVMDVHVKGSFACVKAVWPQMLAQQYGRIVVTSSSAAFHGNFGQANYAAAKAAIIGFARTLALEGRKAGVLINTLAPVGITDMNRSLFKPEMETVLSTARLAPFVAAMCHERMRYTGLVIEAGGGWAGAMRWERAAGLALDDASLSLENILDRWTQITDFAEGSSHPADISQCLPESIRDV